MAQHWMLGILVGKLLDMLDDTPSNRRTQLANLRFQTAEQRPIGLGASAHGLIEMLMRRPMQAPEPIAKQGQVSEFIR